MLAKPHPWDTVQMPVNVMDRFYRSFQRQVLPVARRKGVAVLGMKSLGGGGPPAGEHPGQAQGSDAPTS